MAGSLFFSFQGGEIPTFAGHLARSRTACDFARFLAFGLKSDTYFAPRACALCACEPRACARHASPAHNAQEPMFTDGACMAAGAWRGRRLCGRSASTPQLMALVTSCGMWMDGWMWHGAAVTLIAKSSGINCVSAHIAFSLFSTSVMDQW